MHQKLHFMKSYLHWCQMFGVAKLKPPGFKFKTYITFLLTFHVLSYLYLTYGNAMGLYRHVGHFKFTAVIIDQLSVSFIALTCICANISIGFVHPNTMHEFFKLLKYFDGRIGGKGNSVVSYWFWMAAMQIDGVMILTVDAFVGLNVLGMQFYSIHIGRNVEVYMAKMARHLLHWLVIEITDRFKSLNKYLEENYHPGKISFISNVEQAKAVRIIRDVAKLHDSLCDSVNMLNNLYGSVLLFDVLAQISIALLFTIIMILCSLAPNGGDWSWLFSVCCIWIMESIINIFLLALSGDRVAKQANSIVPLCYKLLHRLDSNVLLESHLVKKEIKTLIQQVTQRKPCLDAAGFFVVNFNMVGFVVTSFTSYIIVAVQFLLKEA